MPLLDTADMQINYRYDGSADAPVLVLSNSLGTDLEMWAPQVAAFSRAFRVLRYDSRGHGGSSLASGPCTLDQLGRDVLALLDGLGIERAHFCGISMGGLVGQWLGVNAPARLRSLVLANTAARIGSESGWRERAALVRARGMDEVAAGAAGRWFTPAFVAADPAPVKALVDCLRASPATGYAACCDALVLADLRDSISAIPVPTLVLAGSFDPVTTGADADFIAGKVAGAVRADLAASHLSNIEQADAFNAAVMRFLAD